MTLFHAMVLSAGICLTFAAPIAAQAATNLNSSKSNIYRPVANEADKSLCSKVNGRIIVDNGKRFCVNPSLPSGWTQKQLPSCETCNRLCPGVCFMHVEGGCICFYDPLRQGN